jgi:hypothetical protein
MSSSNSDWVEVGEVLRGKELDANGKAKSYIKVKSDVHLKNGDVLTVHDPRLSKMSDEQKAKIPDFVLYRVSLNLKQKNRLAQSGTPAGDASLKDNLPF